MIVSILGASGYPRSLEERSSCFFLPEHGVLLDAGSGLSELPRHPAYRMTHEFHILLSHLHVDHLVGLLYLLPTFTADGKRVALYGDERLPSLGRLFEEPFFSSVEGNRTPLRPKPLAERLTIGRLTVNVTRFPHDTSWTNAFRLTDGNRTFMYCTDTTADSSRAENFRTVDLLIHECNYPDRLAETAKAEGHSYPQAVAALAKAASVSRLLLSHTEPRFRDEILRDCQSAFPGAAIAADGLTLKV